MLSNQNQRVLKTLFNIKLVSENNNDTSQKKIEEPRRIITKKLVEMNLAHVVQVKNTNNVMEAKY